MILLMLALGGAGVACLLRAAYLAGEASGYAKASRKASRVFHRVAKREVA